MAEDASPPETGPPQTGATPYERLGGEDVIKRIAGHFYDVMETDPSVKELRAMHAPDLSVMRSKLADWITGALGGPPRYAERPDKGCMVSVHRAYPIGGGEVDQWMYCLRQAFDKAGVDPELRAMLDAPFLDLATKLRSR